MSARTERSIVPSLDGQDSPDSHEEYEEEVKALLEGEVDTRSVDDSDFVYEFDEETDDGAVYDLVNEEELGLDDLPGMEAVDTDFSVLTDSYSGIDRIGVDQDGSVTLETSEGGEETYFLAGTYQGQAAIKDDNGIIWRYDVLEDELEYRNSNAGEWVESDSRKHKAKFDKVVDFQQQLWAVNRAFEQNNGWSHSDRDKGKRDVMKSRFDMVMRELALHGEYEAEDNKRVTSGGAKAEAVVSDFDKARKRFRAYGLLEYGIDPEEEVEVAGDDSFASYEPEGL